MGEENTVGGIVKRSGLVLMLFGFILGFVIWIMPEFTYELGAFKWIIGTLMMIGGIFAALMCYGLAEGLRLLESIRNQNRTEEAQDEVQLAPTLPIQKEDQAEINQYFHERNKSVDSITPTEQEDVYVVYVDGVQHIVETGGFTLKFL
ncbi:hypothetical protein [Halobacillus salinus]|uniref:Uncharacterized protein n=1 Tax=Halobacillus salinus TaxID=192814 RepID=A0A4Z0H0V4_9BACI|nr:hypothetical protein [Halobacillus salinus]TGB02422.1 hypothetical protein E4663_13870 [Halobacillus salinus]